MARFAIVALGTLPGIAHTQEKAQIVTYRCHFTAGARAGQIQDFSKFSNVSPALVGAACQDGSGNLGIAIADGSDELPPRRPLFDDRGVPVLAPGLGWTCRFNHGPRAGTTQQFRPPYMAFRIGKDCADGAGSSGVAVAQ